MKFSIQKSTALAIALTLLCAGSSAVAADRSVTDTKAAATERAATQAIFQSQMSTYIAATRAIRDTHRATAAKALADFQSALSLATTDLEIEAAKNARKASRVAADEIAKSALGALVKPLKPVKPAKPSQQAQPTA